MSDQYSKLKEHVTLSLSVALFLSMTFFVFGPLEIILSAASDFWFQLGDVLPTVMVAFAIAFFIAFLFLFLVSAVGEAVFAILFGLGLAMYVQGNFMFTDYGVMDGTPIDWTSFGSWPKINTLIWIAIAVVPLVLLLWKRKLCKKVITYISLGIVCMQIITIGTLLLTTGPNAKSEIVVSADHQLELSAGNNIVVILADGFDGNLFSKIAEKEPELIAKLDGFTFFADNCGTSIVSEESGITLLTGNQFDVGPSFSENVAEAYRTSLFYDALKQNGYAVNVYANEKMISKAVAENIDNVYYDTKKVSSMHECGQLIYKMVAFRYMPHVLKSNFWYTTMDFSDLAVSATNRELYSWSNAALYNQIVQQGVTVGSAENAYQFYWIQGPHEPVIMDRNCMPLANAIQMNDPRYAGAQYEQAVGVVTLVGELVQELKNENLYHNTTIIFAADHGWNTRQNPLLTIKPAGASGPLRTSNAPTSMIEDYMPTLMHLITGSKEYGRTVFDIEEGEKRDRLLYIYDINPDRTYNSREEVIFPAGSFGPASVPKLETAISEDFSKESGHSLKKSGWYLTEEWGSWASQEASMEFLMDRQEDVTMTLTYNSFEQSAETTVLYNGHIVDVLPYHASRQPVQVVLPAQYYNQDGLQKIVLSTPAAVSPKSVGMNKDARLLAVGVSHVTLEKGAEEGPVKTEEVPLLPSDGIIDFSESGNCTQFLGNGWHNQEKIQRWTSESAELFFTADWQAEQILELTFWRFPSPGNTSIYCNQSLIGTITENGNVHTEQIVIPKECIRQDGRQSITFVTEQALSPADAGMGEDARKLGISVQTLRIAPRA